MEYVEEYGAMALVALMLVFLVFGMLFGLGRGFKRSAIRLVFIIIFIGGAFLLTPAIVRAAADISLPINIDGIVESGDTVRDVADRFVGKFLEENPDWAARLEAVIPDFEIFLFGVGLALINVVVFIAMFFLGKWLSWILYSIFAGKLAPKRDKTTGEKLKRHRFFGMLVGAVQGLVLFFFIMIPVNGVLGVVGKVANYEPLEGADLSVSGQSVYGQDISSEPINYDNPVSEVMDMAKRLNNAFTGDASSFAPIYSGIMRYTGMEWLSEKAFSYQMTVPLEDGATVVLTDDLVKGATLAVDTVAVMNRFNELDFDPEGDALSILTKLTAKDYDALRYVVNKMFTLDSFKLVDSLIAQTDAVLAAGDGEELCKLDNVSVKTDSWYAEMASFAKAGQEREFIAGLRTVVKYVTSSGTGILRNDIITFINMAQHLSQTEVTVNSEKVKLISVLTDDDGLNLEIMLDVLTQNVGNNTTPFDILFNDYLSFETFKILDNDGTKKIVENGDFAGLFEGSGFEDMHDVAIGVVLTLIGDDAMVWSNGQLTGGKWFEVKNTIKSVLTVGKAFAGAPEIISGYASDNEGNFAAAILKYLTEDLLDESASTDEEKYEKIYAFAGALYDIAYLFPDQIPAFARDYIDTKVEFPAGFEEVKAQILTLFDAGADKEYWQDTVAAVADIAVALGDVLENVMSGEEMDMNTIIEKISDPEGDIIELIKNNTIAADIVGGAIEGLVNQMGTDPEGPLAGVSIEFTKTEGHYDKDAIAAIGGAMQVVTELSETGIEGAAELMNDPETKTNINGALDAMISAETKIGLPDSVMNDTTEIEDGKTIAQIITEQGGVLEALKYLLNK